MNQNHQCIMHILDVTMEFRSKIVLISSVVENDVYKNEWHYHVKTILENTDIEHLKCKQMMINELIKIWQ